MVKDPLKIAVGEFGTTEYPPSSNKEIWKSIPRYEGCYEVSSMGRVRSLDRVVPGRTGGEARIKGKILKPIRNAGGYLRVNLCNEDGHKSAFIHRLVAETFLPNLNQLPEVNHKDENPQNNCVSNLEWCSSKYNSNYGNHKVRVSEGTRGRKKCFSPEGLRSIRVSKEKAVIGERRFTGDLVFFRSMKEAEKHGFSQQGISHCVTRRQRTHRGFTWRLVG